MTLFKKLQDLPTCCMTIIAAVFYSAITSISLLLSFENTNAAPIWLPAGFAFIAVWFLGYRVWPGIFLGAVIADWAGFTHHGWALIPAAAVSALIGLGSTVEVLFGVFLLRKFVDQRMILFTIKDIFKYIFAVSVACLTNSTIGTSAVYFFHPGMAFSFDKIWLTWWLGDIAGILLIASAFLTFHKKSWQIGSLKSVIEVVLISLVLIIVNSGVFMERFPEYGFYAHVTYWVLPFTIWFTYRFGFPGAIISIYVTSIIAVSGLIHQLGPFMGPDVMEGVVILQSFIGLIVATVLILAAALYERQKAEEEIKYKEAYFRSLVENSFEVIALVDTEGKTLYSSPPTRYVLGYDVSELVGRSMFEHMHPDDVSKTMATFFELVGNPGGIAYATCRMKRKDGTWRWMEGSGHNLLHDPAIGAIIINYRDITERKLSQERFELAVEFSPVAKIMVNKEGMIQLVNKATEKLFGYAREELLKMNVESLIPEKFRLNHLEYREIFLRSPRPMGVGRELCGLRKDGRQVPIEIGLTPIETEYGLNVLASIVDISQRKKAEEILKRDKESLELLVDERSKELIKTQKELKHFSRLADIGTLAATVAHELRNPLGVIHLAAHNLKKEKNDLCANRHLVNIEKKVWEGNQIIDNLLSYARIKIPHYENVYIIDILDECIVNAQGRFGEKEIIIDKQYDDGLACIKADPNQMREIFSNILDNACQAFVGNSGHVKIKIERDMDMVKVFIQDSGVGIAQEDLDRIFEPFFTRKSKGTGLGLTICNELVNLHQGKIEINSWQGQGTTVCVFLPIERRNNT